MKQPHLLRVERPVGEFAPLIAAVQEVGARVGWLELAAPEMLPESLEQAASCGVLRAVAVGDGRSVTVKPLRGQAVVRDLLREHFRGCMLVLVRGAVSVPLLEPCDDDWIVTVPGRSPTRRTTEELLAALRKPRAWGGASETFRHRSP